MPFIIFLLILILLVVVKNVRVVQQSNCYVIEFLGSYKTTWESGLHVKIPFIESVVNKISLKEQVSDFPPQPVITKDNVTMQIDTVVYWQVFDAKLFTYGSENPVFALENLSATTLRNIIGDLDLDQTLTSRDIVNTKMRDILDEATDAWGIKVNRVELKNIMPPAEIQQSMEQQMKAERDKRKKILDAEAHRDSERLRAQGDKEAAILKAEAEKESKIIRAQGEADSIKLVYEAEARGLNMLSKANVSDSVMTLKKLEALKSVGDGRATKIIMPTDLASSASNLQFVGEMIGANKSENEVDRTEKVKVKVQESDECCKDIPNLDICKTLPGHENCEDE